MAAITLVRVTAVAPRDAMAMTGADMDSDANATNMDTSANAFGVCSRRADEGQCEHRGDQFFRGTLHS